MRPIDADELEELWAGISPNATVHPDSVIDTIKRAKTIKDVNQVHAHWIPECPNKRTGKAYRHTCSECGRTVYDSRQVSIDEMGYYFCPCCGARMDGKDGEQDEMC